MAVQRISDELAECFDSRDGNAMMTAFLVSPFGTAVWQVEVGRNGDGAFLGRRWPEFVEAHGISFGWLVLRHIGRGMLTVKAFDGTCLIKEFGQTLTGDSLSPSVFFFLFLREKMCVSIKMYSTILFLHGS